MSAQFVALLYPIMIRHAAPGLKPVMLCMEVPSRACGVSCSRTPHGSIRHHGSAGCSSQHSPLADSSRSPDSASTVRKAHTNQNHCAWFVCSVQIKTRQRGSVCLCSSCFQFLCSFLGSSLSCQGYAACVSNPLLSTRGSTRYLQFEPSLRHPHMHSIRTFPISPSNKSAGTMPCPSQILHSHVHPEARARAVTPEVSACQLHSAAAFHRPLPYHSPPRRPPAHTADGPQCHRLAALQSQRRGRWTRCAAT